MPNKLNDNNPLAKFLFSIPGFSTWRWLIAPSLYTFPGIFLIIVSQLFQRSWIQFLVLWLGILLVSMFPVGITVSIKPWGGKPDLDPIKITTNISKFIGFVVSLLYTFEKHRIAWKLALLIFFLWYVTESLIRSELVLNMLNTFVARILSKVEDDQQPIQNNTGTTFACVYGHTKTDKKIASKIAARSFSSGFVPSNDPTKIEDDSLIDRVLLLDISGETPSTLIDMASKSLAFVFVIDDELSVEYRDLLYYSISSCNGCIYIIQNSRYGNDSEECMWGTGISTLPLYFKQMNPLYRTSKLHKIEQELQIDLSMHSIYLDPFPDSVYSNRLFSRLNSHGLPPISDCFLRARFSSNSTEMYLSIFDCFEVLIKVSTVVLLTYHLKHGALSHAYIERLKESLKRPSLGQWVEILHYLCKACKNKDSDEYRVSQIWKGAIATAPKDAVDEAAGLGMDWKSPVPRSYLEWLNWLVWLRNSTRGHGVVDDDFSDQTWPTLYLSYVELMISLEPICFGALNVDDSSEFGYICKGWSRSTCIATGDIEIKKAWTIDVAFQMYNSLHTESISVHPFVLYSGGTFWIWKSYSDKRVDYINYSTGEMQSVLISINGAIDEWLKMNQGGAPPIEGTRVKKRQPFNSNIHKNDHYCSLI